MNAMKIQHLVLVTAISGLLAAVAGMASAQTAAAPAASQGAAQTQAHSGPGMMQHGGARDMTPEQRQARMKEHFAQRTQALHDKLQLDAGQEAAWNTYLQSMTPSQRGPRPDRAELARLSAPQRMEKQMEMLKQHETELGRRLEATKTFYAALKPEQQKVFDQETARMRGGHGQGAHRHGHAGHHGAGQHKS